MDAVISSRQTRAQHRLELRTLAYVTLDQGNGGIVRNLSQHGIGLQVVAAVRPQQQLRVRFELRFPRLQVESLAEVVWATSSGQCGIRFVDMPASLKRQINQWILGDLLDRIPQAAEHAGPIFAPLRPAPAIAQSAGADSVADEPEIDDGLLVSGTPVNIIELPTRPAPAQTVSDIEVSAIERPLA